MGDTFDIGRFQGVDGVCEAEACVAQDGSAQSVMEDACQEIFQCLVRHHFFAVMEQGNHFFVAQISEEIQMDGHGCFSCGDGAGNFKDGGAADAEIRELDFPCVFRQNLTVSFYQNGTVSTNAFQGFYISGICFDLHQYGEEFCHGVAHAFQQFIAALGAAQFAACHTAAADDDRIRLQGFFAGKDLETTFFAFFQSSYFKGSTHFYPCFFQCQTEHIYHTARLIGKRVDLAAGFHSCDESQILEIFQCFFHRESGKGKVCKPCILSVVIFQCQFCVGEVAAAVACGKELAAHTSLTFQNGHFCTLFSGREGSHHTCCTAADDRYFHIFTFSM